MMYTSSFDLSIHYIKCNLYLSFSLPLILKLHKYVGRDTTWVGWVYPNRSMGEF